MNRIILIIGISLLVNCSLFAQYANYSNVQQGEVGITFGAAHYFGDLNNRADVSRPKPSVGIFFRKQFGNYIGLRLAGRFAQLGYSDQYSKNEYQLLRNLSFNTNIYEVALQGDFNFFKFVPGDGVHNFTPYVTLGVGLFSYDPYAYLADEKYYLRPLGTEGQYAAGGKKPYGNTSFCIPFGAGIKYAMTDKFNISIEAAHRFTGTDYIDDVSGQYAGIDKFEPNSPAALLQDRSYEIDKNNILGVAGRQRGFAKQKDQYLILEVGISFNISSYRCPTAN